MTEIERFDGKWDLVVIGGGASGLGVALDAISRGMKVLLVEKDDFGKGTSSRSTKLIHGGVRYLAQGNISLVKEALKERSFIMERAPHISRKQSFIIPFYNRLEGIYYYAGLKTYDILSGRRSIGKTSWKSRNEVITYIPNIKKSGLKGGIQYFDGQFDDARLCIDIVRTIIKGGGTCINYCEFTSFIKDRNGKICGVNILNQENGTSYIINSSTVVNAAGIYSNDIVKNDSSTEKDLVSPSRGSHLVFDDKILGGSHAIMIPKTSDGRVLFIIPWLNSTVVGTTDEKTHNVEKVPMIRSHEVDFILNNARKYLEHTITKAEIKSTYAGLRPLAAPKKNNTDSKEISRGHKIVKSQSGLYSIIGGKWTTFRKMGQDMVNKIVIDNGLPVKPSTSFSMNIEPPTYSLPPQSDPLYPEGMMNIFENEMVVKVEDYIARRTRTLFKDAKKAESIIKEVTTSLASFLDKNPAWINIEVEKAEELVKKYMYEGEEVTIDR